MFAFLRALGLRPVGWVEAVHRALRTNPHTYDVVMNVMDDAQAIVVLLSPDEVVYLKRHLCADGEDDGGVGEQPRANVLLEAGLALGAYPDKTVIVQVGKVRPISDLAGMDIVMLSDVISRNDLANRLAKIGCPVSKVGNDWMTVGVFKATEPKIEGLPQIRPRETKAASFGRRTTPPFGASLDRSYPSP